MLSTLAEMAGLESFEWRVESRHPAGPEAPYRQAAGARCQCWAPFTEAHVRANGHLVVCSHDYSGVSFVADLKETEFAEAWLSAAFRKTRRGVLKGERNGTLCTACPRNAPKDGRASIA